MDRIDIRLSDHNLVWFKLEKNFARGRIKAKCSVCKWRLYRLHDKIIRNEYQAELGIHAKISEL